MKASLIDRQQLFVAAAIIAAHSNSAPTGFRQRDVRFLIDLFANWAEGVPTAELATLQNTQIGRHLEALTVSGLLKRAPRGNVPLYTVTRAGVLELLRQMQEQVVAAPGQAFFFLFYWLHCYRDRISQLASHEGQQFPPALRIELETLLDTEALVARQLKQIDKRIAALRERIDSALRTKRKIEKGLSLGERFSSLVSGVERESPYELNSQKPLTELVRSIPSPQQEWELTTGNEARVLMIWQPMLDQLTALRSHVNSLLQASHRIPRLST